MQWHALIGAANPVNPTSDVWPYGSPEPGNLDAPQLAALCAILAVHTSAADDCWFCLWDGWGWSHGSPAVARLGSDAPVPPAIDADVLAGPKVRLPGREYFLFTGPLGAILGAGWEPEPGFRIPQSPSLFWPDDRTWCVATEIDFESTLVAGSAQLIDQILNSASLDAWPIAPSDSLRSDGDQINGA